MACRARRTWLAGSRRRSCRRSCDGPAHTGPCTPARLEYIFRSRLSCQRGTSLHTSRLRRRPHPPWASRRRHTTARRRWRQRRPCRSHHRDGSRSCTSTNTGSRRKSTLRFAEKDTGCRADRKRSCQSEQHRCRGRSSSRQGRSSRMEGQRRCICPDRLFARLGTPSRRCHWYKSPSRPRWPGKDRSSIHRSRASCCLCILQHRTCGNPSDNRAWSMVRMCPNRSRPRWWPAHRRPASRRPGPALLHRQQLLQATRCRRVSRDCARGCTHQARVRQARTKWLAQGWTLENHVERSCLLSARGFLARPLR
jgi:hypothetical protein